MRCAVCVIAYLNVELMQRRVGAGAGGDGDHQAEISAHLFVSPVRPSVRRQTRTRHRTRTPGGEDEHLYRLIILSGAYLSLRCCVELIMAAREPGVGIYATSYRHICTAEYVASMGYKAPAHCEGLIISH